jgi:enoyl-CoA hydratase/carnithine racemase
MTRRPQVLAEYSRWFPNLAMSRADGILEIVMNDGAGGPMVFAGEPHPHGQLTEAFYEVGRDPDNHAVILTGAGGSFIDAIDFGDGPSSLPAPALMGMGSEAIRLLMNLVSIPVPVIAAVDGPAHVQAQLAVLCDIVIASPSADFQDVGHYPKGLVPGDGGHIVWPMVLGPGRGRYFLLTGERICADDAKSIGFVQEIVPAPRLLQRARELAKQILEQPPVTVRYTRALFTHEIKRRLVEELQFGLTAELLAATESFPSGLHR